MGPRGSSRVLARVVAAVLRHRAATLAALACALLIAALGLTRLRFDFSSTAFYGDAGADAGGNTARLREFHRRWGADDRSLAVLVHPLPSTGKSDDATAGVLSPARLAALSQLAAALGEAEQVESVVSVADLRVPVPTLTGAERSLSFAELAETLALASQSPAQRRALLEPLPFVPQLLSSDGLDTVIVVELGFSSDDVMRTKAVVDEIEGILAEHDPSLAALGLQRELAGVPAIRAAFFELLVRDQARFVPLTLLLIGASLLWVFRRLHGVLIPALAAALPTAMLVGIMGWTGEPLGLLNQAYFTLLPVIAVADAIHMVARYHEQRREDPREPREQAIVHACANVGLACLLTSLTTAAGFASLVLADMPILRGFGLYAAIGVVLAFVVSVVLVPVLLSVVRDDRLPRRQRGAGLIDAVVGVALREPKLVVVVSLALCGLGLLGAAQVRIDNTLSALLEPEHPVSVASRRVDARLGGVLGLEFEVTAPSRAELLDPHTLHTLLEFEDWLRAQVEVRSVEGLPSAIAALGLLEAGTAEIPQRADEVARRLELLATSAPLARLLADNEPVMRIHAGMPDAGGKQFVAFAERAEAELARRLAPPLQAHTTGTALLAYRGVNGITEDLRNSFALVFVVVVVVIAASFRSPWPAIAAVLPNLGPLLLGYAALGWLGRVLDPLAAVILTLALGIAVDDTLHVMVRTREQLRAGVGIDAAVRAAMKHSGWAVAVTSVVIAGALLLDLASSFPPLATLGLLGSLVIALALLANLCLLPASLLLLRGRGLERR